MKTNNETLNTSNVDELAQQDQQLDQAALDGVVGGARPVKGETSAKTSDVTKCCW